MAKIWTLEDYYELQQPHQPPWKPFRSIETQYQLDCKRHQLAVLQVLFYSEVDAGGNVISSQNVVQPIQRDAAPDSIGKYLLDAACAPIRNK